MVNVLSKIAPIFVSCENYVHPWTSSCAEASAGLYFYAILDCMRIYGTVYTLALLMRGRIPTKEDLKRTFHGIIQSTAFLSAMAFGYSFFLCSLRRILGNFNILTVSAIPAFLASVFAIIIERPSRRVLLALYVSNVATETFWNMAVSRNMVTPIKNGHVAIFSVSIAILLALYKSGHHKLKDKDKSDSMFGVLRFVIGPYEEKDYSVRSSQANTFYRQEVQNIPGTSGSQRPGSWQKGKHKNVAFHLIIQALRAYKKIIQSIKCYSRHHACPHPFSCVYYTLAGTSKMFTVGLGIQFTLKLVLNLKRIMQSPKNINRIFFKKDILSLALFLGGFSGGFRALSCLFRRITGKDSPYHAIPAGLIAGTAFMQYPDTTVALYVMWKMAQITYNLGIERGYLPKIPGFTNFLYSFSTAVLFHAAILEPTNLRPSYWKFLHSISGGRIACMNRDPLDVWGLNTSESLQKVLTATKTARVVQFYQ